jgi:phage terminase large subunit-like protein
VDGLEAACRAGAGERAVKRADAWSLSITTAGNPKVQSVALTQYEYGKKVESGEVDDPGFLFAWREADVMMDDLNSREALVQAVEQANPEPWKRRTTLHAATRRFRCTSSAGIT